MKIKIEQNTIYISGKLNQESAEEIKSDIFENLDSNIKEITIDFENVDYINSAGIGGIISIYKALIENNRDLFLVKLKPHIYSVFKIAGLTKILNISSE